MHLPKKMIKAERAIGRAGRAKGFKGKRLKRYVYGSKTMQKFLKSRRKQKGKK